MPDCSVVIPAYNRWRQLEQTLAALQNQTVPQGSYEIIVVDDCSSDDTPILMKRLLQSSSSIVYVRHNANKGRASTRNDGIRAAKGEIIILLDHDNVPVPGFIEAHLNLHRIAPDRIAVRGNAYFAADVIKGSNFAMYMQSRYPGCRSESDKRGLDYCSLPPRLFSTINCSARRDDLLLVGMLDCDFIYYGGEDEYLGYRLHKAGVRLVFGEDARTEHHDEVTLPRYKAKLIESAREGTALILQKSPDYYEGTKARFLLPINKTRDSPGRIFTKVLLRIILNPAFVLLLEKWAFLTDRIRGLYFKPLYRALLAGWYLEGLRTKTNSGKSKIDDSNKR